MTLADRVVGDELFGAAGVVVPLSGPALAASAEVDGVVGDDVKGMRGPSPVEARAGVVGRIGAAWQLGARIGFGLDDENRRAARARAGRAVVACGGARGAAGEVAGAVTGRRRHAVRALKKNRVARVREIATTRAASVWGWAVPRPDQRTAVACARLRAPTVALRGLNPPANLRAGETHAPHLARARWRERQLTNRCRRWARQSWRRARGPAPASARGPASAPSARGSAS